MRSIIPLLGLLVFSIPGVATAQGFQGIEIFGGYAYLGNNLSSTYSPFYLSAVPFGNNFPLNGWQASLTENATDWLGLTQEFGGLRDKEDPGFGQPFQYVFNSFWAAIFLSAPQGSNAFCPRVVWLRPDKGLVAGYESISDKQLLCNGAGRRDGRQGVSTHGRSPFPGRLLPDAGFWQHPEQSAIFSRAGLPLRGPRTLTCHSRRDLSGMRKP